ncbi:cytochrome P450 [Phenylobacterium sp.]|uniref:cytochrome P450 n=1 Tax=Phenylobacterium sp. TaxID=1871053 RepID=UPI00301E5D88
MIDTLEAARADAYATPLEEINVHRRELFRDYTLWPYFERLRKEAPIHWCAAGEPNPYWSVTRYADILEVNSNHQVFSSEDGIALSDKPKFQNMGFIAMDPPRHDAHRKVVSPIVAPHNLARLEGLIRSRAAEILDDLPVGETFDWVDRVSVELTTQMLATLFDFPFDERRKLTRWSNVASSEPGSAYVATAEQRQAELMECGAYFARLWNERVNADPGNDLISMLAHSDVTRNMTPEEFLGTILLLVVGGNDTTRNSITGSVVALNDFPEQYDKLLADPALLASMVPEVIRWQTPIAYMRRTALADVEMHGKTIRKGDRVLMWYVSGNRDDTVIENPEAFVIDRERPRQHMSFGFGVHRCVGNRLAELQLRIVWEEVLKRFGRVEVMEAPQRVYSTFIKGYERLPVRLHA